MKRHQNILRSASCFVLACLFLGSVAPAAADDSGDEVPLWGSLEAGPYEVGFMAVEEYDYGRTFRPKRDYFGTILPGERARPIQVCIWYPAEMGGDAMPIVFSEYAFTPPEDISLYEFLSGIQNREIGFLHRILNNNQVAVLEVLGTDMKAVKGADNAEGMFPLLIYHSDFNSGIAESAVMCEYLASHGFVVATTHSFGLAAIRSEPSPAGLEAIVGDMEFIMVALRDLDFIDPNKLGVLGYRAGWLAALVLQMRNYNVDAVVGLETALADPQHAEWVTGNSCYDVSRMAVPLLEICSGAREDEDRAFTESLKYSNRYSLEFRDTRGLDFTTYGLLPAMFLPTGSNPPLSRMEAYHNVCRYVLNFFDAHLNGKEESLAYLARSPSENGMGPDQVTVRRLEAHERPPTQDEFFAILEEGRVETAGELYEKFRAIEPELILFPEAAMNLAGYRFLQRGMVSEAIALFRMNADTYPRSANCWDSLAEAYIAGGDNQHALECVEKVLEVLPQDTNIGDDLRDALENNAQRYMDMLRQE
jgi:hypothetical protein